MPGKDNHRPLTSKTQKVSKAPKVASKEEKERELFKAAGDGNLEMVVKLLKEGVEANYIGYSNNTPLTEAAGLNHEKIVDALLQVENINVNSADKDGMTALHWAVMKENKEMVIKLLQDPRIDINAKDNNGNSAIYSAIADNNEEIVDIFLQNEKFYINYFDKNGTSPLKSVIFREYVNILVKILNFKGIDVNIIDKNGLSALSFAVDADNKNILKLMLQVKGIDTSVLTKEDWDKVYLAFPDYANNAKCILKDADRIEVHDAIDKTHIQKLNGQEISDEYDALGAGSDYSSDTHSSLYSGSSVSAEKSDEDPIDPELTGVPLNTFLDFQ